MKAGLSMSNPDLAKITGLHRNTLNKADKGEATRSTWALLRLEFERRGIVFVAKNGGPAGVRFQADDDA